MLRVLAGIMSYVLIVMFPSQTFGTFMRKIKATLDIIYAQKEHIGWFSLFAE